MNISPELRRLVCQPFSLSPSPPPDHDDDEEPWRKTQRCWTGVTRTTRCSRQTRIGPRSSSRRSSVLVPPSRVATRTSRKTLSLSVAMRTRRILSTQTRLQQICRRQLGPARLLGSPPCRPLTCRISVTTLRVRPSPLLSDQSFPSFDAHCRRANSPMLYLQNPWSLRRRMSHPPLSIQAPSPARWCKENDGPMATQNRNQPFRNQATRFLSTGRSGILGMAHLNRTTITVEPVIRSGTARGTTCLAEARRQKTERTVLGGAEASLRAD